MEYLSFEAQETSVGEMVVMVIGLPTDLCHSNRGCDHCDLIADRQKFGECQAFNSDSPGKLVGPEEHSDPKLQHSHTDSF